MDINEPLVPQSRVEEQLAYIAELGERPDEPPQSRVEKYLDYIIDHGGGGSSDYEELTNKPSINGVELSGDKTSEDLDINIPKVYYTITEPLEAVDGDFWVRPDDRFKIVALEDETTVGAYTYGSVPGRLEYSFDGVSWSSLGDTEVSLAHTGDFVYFRGNGEPIAVTSMDCTTFYGTGKFAVKGNVTYLYDPGSDVCGYYDSLFYECEALVDASEFILPATTLVDYCYEYMFCSCPSLVTAPVLPATTLAPYCYSNMFYGCTSLTEGSEISATTLAEYCCEYMFEECTSLVEAPELPATELAEYCYSYMFHGCTSLTEAPSVLPATTLVPYCYDYMFKDCTSLTEAPDLQATTLAEYCCEYMFEGCTSLTEAPELPATELAEYCYYYMFHECTSLVEAPELPATTLAPYCYDDMFYDCTSLTEAPELPATELAENCYYYMFEGCTSLVTAPYLPATDLVTECYEYMFYNCSSLNNVSVAFSSWYSDVDATSSWLDGVSTTGTFTSPAALPDERGDSAIPDGWTKVPATA